MNFLINNETTDITAAAGAATKVAASIDDGTLAVYSPPPQQLQQRAVVSLQTHPLSSCEELVDTAKLLQEMAVATLGPGVDVNTCLTVVKDLAVCQATINSNMCMEIQRCSYQNYEHSENRQQADRHHEETMEIEISKHNGQAYQQMLQLHKETWTVLYQCVRISLSVMVLITIVLDLYQTKKFWSESSWTELICHGIDEELLFDEDGAGNDDDDGGLLNDDDDDDSRGWYFSIPAAVTSYAFRGLSGLSGHIVQKKGWFEYIPFASTLYSTTSRRMASCLIPQALQVLDRMNPLVGFFVPYWFMRGLFTPFINTMAQSWLLVYALKLFGSIDTDKLTVLAGIFVTYWAFLCIVMEYTFHQHKTTTNKPHPRRRDDDDGHAAAAGSSSSTCIDISGISEYCEGCKVTYQFTSIALALVLVVAGQTMKW